MLSIFLINICIFNALQYVIGWDTCSSAFEFGQKEVLRKQHDFFFKHSLVSHAIFCYFIFQQNIESAPVFWLHWSVKHERKITWCTFN